MLQSNIHAHVLCAPPRARYVFLTRYCLSAAVKGDVVKPVAKFPASMNAAVMPKDVSPSCVIIGSDLGFTN